ncbi:hypothetical protein FRC03_001137 [Tulasnella sp. 419]|nr:hypothetical protein FRC03_001137 [Tulasnella sp. 419]
MSCLFGRTYSNSWEILNTWSYEWSLITRRRTWKWPLLAWFVCRYSCLLMLIVWTYNVSATQQINCQSMTEFTQFASNIAIGCATLLLMLRTFAVWNVDLKIVIPCSVVAVGHWTLLGYDTIAYWSTWNPETGNCIPTARSSSFLLAAPYVYTITFDLLILCLTTAGLIINTPDSRGTHLWQLLFRDGLAFFFIVTIANALPTIFILLEYNAVMNLIFTVPAAVVNALVATRLVVRLSDYVSRDTVYVSSSAQKAIAARVSMLGGGHGANSAASTRTHRKSHSSHLHHGGVQITMETFTETTSAPVRPLAKGATTAATPSPNGTARVTFAGTNNSESSDIEVASVKHGDSYMDYDEDEKNVGVVVDEDDDHYSGAVAVTVVHENGPRRFA